MKIVHKMTLAFVAGTCAILAANGVQRVRREVALFESNAVRDHRSLGRTLRTTVQTTWASSGERDALQIVDEANRQNGRVQFRWLWLDGAVTAHVPIGSLSAETAQDALSTVSKNERGEPARFTYVSAIGPNGRKAALEVSEPLVGEVAYVRRTIIDSIVTTATLVGVCGLLAMALGLVLVGRPVRMLVEKARRIGAGEFGDPLVVHRRDELAELALEMNAMCDRLVGAQREVASQTSRRIATLEQLRHADRLSTVGTLASGIAHELGTPLNVILGRAAMVATGEAEGEEALDCARSISQAAARMTAIIRQLLDFARRRGPQRAMDDLSAIARQTVALLRSIASKKSVTLDLVAPSEARAEVDAGQIQQALTNLIINAIQAVPTGSAVEVAAGRANAAMLEASGVEHRPGCEYAFLRVRDHGPGIAEEMRAHIFEPFFTSKGVGEGTGLGLSVSWGIVQDHDGFIAVSSEPTQSSGTTFTIFVPTDRRDSA